MVASEGKSGTTVKEGESGTVAKEGGLGWGFVVGVSLRKKKKKEKGTYSD